MPAAYLQEKFESIPGNETNAPTLSTKILYPPAIEYTFDPGTNHMERNDELRANNEPQAVLTERYAPTWSMNGRVYPDGIGWRLKHILGPPTTTITDAGGPKGVEVALWDDVIFDLVPITRSRQRDLDALQKQFEELDEEAEDATDKAVELLAKMLDVQLKPTNGHRKLASAFVVAKWQSDELTSDQLMTFVQRVAEAGRPT
jgi:hypothetical protein